MSVIGRTLSAVIAAMFVLMGGLVFGPTVESTLFPVIVDHTIAYRVERGRLIVTHELDKQRQCPIERRVRSVRDEITSIPVRFGGPMNRVDRGRDHRFEAQTRLPSGVAPPFDVTGTFYYRCHALWLTPYRLPTVTVAAPPPGD